jgi:large subunit ribosomal protein L14
MLKIETIVPIIDNSGGVSAKCIKVLKKKSQVGIAGNIIVVAINKVVANKKITKGQLFKALVVKTRFLKRRGAGQFSFSKKNGVILLKKNEIIPYANRIKGLLFLDLRKHGFVKLLSMCDQIL